MSARDRYRVASKHWHRLPGLRQVQTDAAADATLAIDKAVAAAGISVLDGDPGTGKTFLLKTILETLAIPHWYLPVGPLATGKAFEVGLLKEVYDRMDPPGRVDRSKDRSDLRIDLAEELSLEPGVVIIDDFKPSGRAGIEDIRWLSEQPGNQTAFILAGNDLSRLMRSNPPFYSRVMQIVPFEPFAKEEAAALMAGVHPLLEAANLKVLWRLHDEHTRGNFRALAIFLEFAIPIAAGLGVTRVTDEVLDLAVAQINKRPPVIQKEAA